MKKKTKLLVDFPGGFRYGFPIEWPFNYPDLEGTKWERQDKEAKFFYDNWVPLMLIPRAVKTRKIYKDQ